MQKTSRAFTLIELLVVIAIISILAALLYPVFVSARERGRATYCANNMKMLGTALFLYADNWEGAYPRQGAGEGSDAKGNLHSFIAPLVPYLQKRRQGSWICPSDPLLVFDRGKNDIITSYAGSVQFFNHDTAEYCDKPDDPPRMRDEVKDPTSVVMVYEGVPTVAFPATIWIVTSEPENISVWIGNYHQGRANFCFADGHIRFMTLRQTLVPRVLWDNVSEWCPECGCAQRNGWKPEYIPKTLALMDQDRAHYP